MVKKIIIVLIFGFLIQVNIFSLPVFGEDIVDYQVIPQERPSEEEYCFDLVNVLPPKLVHEINIQGDGLKRHYDIDFVVVIISSLEGKDIVSYTAELFSRWQIGKSTQGKKGILILIAQKEGEIKIEVGYDLEEVYTDLYVAQVEREMLKEFLEQADWERGFLATIENFVERTYRMYKKGIDVGKISSDDRSNYYSGGAGATNVFDFGAALKKPLPQTPQELKDYFSAQVTPQVAFQRYMEFNTKNMSDYTVDLFSDLSKEFFSHWRTSSGQRRSEAEAVAGVPYIVRQEGKYAVVMFPCNDDIEEFIRHCPYFFIKTDKGWQIDINTLSRSIIMGGPSWHFMSKWHPYMFAFKDYLIQVDRYYPLRGQKAFLGLVYLKWNEQYKGYQIHPDWSSPAKKAGIESGDVLLSLDGVVIKEAYQDWEMMKEYNPGDVVELAVVRAGKKIRIDVPLEEIISCNYNEDYPLKREEGIPWIGLYLGYSEPYERDIVDSGVSVLYVVENSPAQKAGFKPGDLIIDIPEMKEPQASMWDYFDLLKNRKPQDKVTFKVLRDLKERLDITVEIGSYSRGREGW